MMKLKWMVVVVMLAFSLPVYAEVDCEKLPGHIACQGGDNGGGGGDPTGGGDVYIDISGGNQNQEQNQSQEQYAEGGDAFAYGEGGNAFSSSGAVASTGDVSVTTGDVANDITNTNTNTNSNDVSVQNDVSNTNTNTANGGDGGDASASAVVAEGAVDNDVDVTVNAGTTYQQVRQAPSIAQGSFAISGCSVGGNAGGSNKNGAAFLGFGWTPKECYAFMLAQAYQSIGQYKAVCDILRNTKTGKRLERDGIELPECLPEIVVVPAPVDLSEYATKEELNRAFEKSQMK